MGLNESIKELSDTIASSEAIAKADNMGHKEVIKLIVEHENLKLLFKGLKYFAIGFMICIVFLGVFGTIKVMQNREVTAENLYLANTLTKFKNYSDSLKIRLKKYELWRAVCPKDVDDYIEQAQEDRFNNKIRCSGKVGSQSQNETLLKP